MASRVGRRESRRKAGKVFVKVLGGGHNRKEKIRKGQISRRGKLGGGWKETKRGRQPSLLQAEASSVLRHCPLVQDMALGATRFDLGVRKMILSKFRKKKGCWGYVLRESGKERLEEELSLVEDIIEP